MISQKNSSNFRVNRALVAVFVVGLMILANACASKPEDESADRLDQIASADTVHVSVGNITPVITIEGEIRGPVDFQITSKVFGSVRSISASQIVIVDRDGVTHSISNDSDVTYASLQPDGAQVVPGLPIAQAQYSLFALVATLEGADLNRLVESPESVRAQINGAGAPFKCQLLDERPSTSHLNELQQDRYLACKVPDDQQVIGGMRGLMALQFESRVGVLILPIQAVAGSIQNGTVYVKEDGRVVEKTVVLGASDGLNIEIVSGLVDGQEVLIPSPSLYK